MNPDTELKLGQESIPLYIARPQTPPPWPGVLVIHEIFGLNDDIRRIADRFAQNGYLAWAPDILSGAKPMCMFRAIRDLGQGGGKTLERAQAALQGLRESPELAAGRVGVAGFCMGSGYALLLGSEGLVNAVADNYGQVPPDPLIEKLCPVVASYGAKDTTLRKAPPRLEAGLKNAGIPYDLKVYPEAGHSFMNHHTGLLGRLGPRLGMGYVETAAEDAWQRILKFFSEHV